MSRINRAITLATLSLLFGGCFFAPMQPQPKNEPVSIVAEQEKLSVGAKETQEFKTLENNETQSVDLEAPLFMSAIEALDSAKFDEAAFYLSKLYTKTQKREYLVELVRIYTMTGELKKAEAMLQEALKRGDNTDLNKMLAANYISQKEYQKAYEIARLIAEKTKLREDYDTAGSIAFVINDYKSALKYFKLSYSLKPDSAAADRVGAILFAQNKEGEAVSFLESHVRMYGCAKNLCEKLAASYLEKNDKTGALETYKKLHAKFKEEKYVKKIIELSVAGSDIEGLITFLKKSKKDEKLLLEAYKYKKDNKNASLTARRIYKQTNNLDYLAQAAIYKFESYPEKKPTKLIKESVKDLETVVKGIQNDVYDNYLGYLLIDYDIDVNKGVELVQRALQKDPVSLFYKDSLAWGYYKQKKCEQAYEIIKSVASELKEDKTVQEHLEAIKKCLGEQK